jgi:hypothetical protein
MPTPCNQLPCEAGDLDSCRYLYKNFEGKSEIKKFVISKMKYFCDKNEKEMCRWLGHYSIAPKNNYFFEKACNLGDANACNDSNNIKH